MNIANIDDDYNGDDDVWKVTKDHVNVKFVCICMNMMMSSNDDDDNDDNNDNDDDDGNGDVWKRLHHFKVGETSPKLDLDAGLPPPLLSCTTPFTALYHSQK